VLRAHEVGAPVISVGNLTTGGTGKTPLVEWLATQIAGSGKRGCVLTRGYGRNSSGRVVVSDYSAVLTTVDESGDEPFLLANNLLGRGAVICDANRLAAAHWALSHLSSEVFILDDAFQHQRIVRDFNILTVDATNPWGNRKLLPAGILREPISQLTRADCVVITRADEPEVAQRLRVEIESIAGNIPIFTSRMRLARTRPLMNVQPDKTANYRDGAIAAFCGIGNPNSFFSLLRREKFNLVHHSAFRDHYKYTQADIDGIVADASRHGATALVTTAKDAVKLTGFKFALPCLVADVTIEIDNERQLLALIQQAIRKRN
jgi:tetraacyldisaccharide 4'-kinase